MIYVLVFFVLCVLCILHVLCSVFFLTPENAMMTSSRSGHVIDHAIEFPIVLLRFNRSETLLRRLAFVLFQVAMTKK